MLIRTGALLLLLMWRVLAFAQVDDADFRVLENGHVISLPDSIQIQIKGNIESAQYILLQWLAADGYLNASVDIINITQREAYITRNCAYQLNEIHVSYAGEMDTVQIIKPAIRYTEETLQTEIEFLIFEMFRKGFPFAIAKIKDFNPDEEECSLTIKLEMETGPKAETSEIYFSGNRSNSQDYLRKISRFRTEQYITPNYLRYIRENLNSSGLFNSVGEGQIFLREGEPIIVFEVQERSLNHFDGLLGYVPDAAGNGQIMGDVELSLWNVLAAGNGLKFQYQRLRPETSELDLGISQDWIGGIPVGVSADLQLYQNDTTYQARDLEFGGYYRISGGFKLTGGIGFQGTTSGANIPAVVEPDGEKRTARLGFEFTSIDNIDVPTRGSYFSISLGVANKEIEEDSAGAFSQNTLHLEANHYISVFRKGVLASSLRGFLLEAEKITINDLIRFGGANSFRGYSEQQFRAGTMLWGDLEYRFLLDRSSYLFAFGAAGGYHRPKLLTEANNDFRTTDYLFSTGFGLSYQTRIGRLKFTYAISPEESIANGKVHFGIRTEL